MLTLADFIAKYEGQRVQAPGGLGGQCVDLTELWRLNLGGSRVYRNAADFAALPIPGYRWIPNTPLNMPRPGDCVVWARNPSMPEGHIDIAVDEITVMTFRGFDQNWPLGSPAHLQAHGYWDVAGWQQPVALDPPVPVPPPVPPPPLPPAPPIVLPDVPVPVFPPPTTGQAPPSPGPFDWLGALLAWLRRLFGG